ncbi:MAG: AlbA family DNA-binding domain-containing protein [Nocardioides sp.]
MSLRLRLPAVEQLLGCSLPALDAASIGRLVDESIAETDQLEFKKVATFLEDDPGRDDFAKDVCSLANASGGLIVYGIGEAEGVATELAPFSKPTGELRQRLANILSSRLRPTPTIDADFLATPDDAASGYIVVAVPPSLDAPHAVTKGDGWMSFPVRYLTETEFMREAQLAGRYRDRFRSARAREERLSELMDHAEDVGRESHMEVGLRVAVVPAVPGHFAVSAHAVTDWQERIRGRGAGTRTFGKASGLWGETCTIGVGSISYRSGNCFVDFYRDGSSVLEARWNDRVSFVAMLTREAGDPVRVSAESLCIQLASMLDVATEFATVGAGVAGDLLIGVELTATSEHGTRQPMVLVGKQGGLSNGLGVLTMARPLCASFETSAASHILGGPIGSELISEWHRILTELLNGMGLAESELTTPDGNVTAAGWTDTSREQVESWAKLHGLIAPTDLRSG